MFFISIHSCIYVALLVDFLNEITLHLITAIVVVVVSKQET